MSDTPRTDFQAGWAVSDGGVVKAEYLYADTKGVFVLAAFARELERELVRMTLRRDELQTLIDNEGYPSGADFEKLERELAEEKYQHHLTRGVADLAIKHRDEAERDNARMTINISRNNAIMSRMAGENAKLREALKLAEPYVPKRADCETRRMIESLSPNARAEPRHE